LPPRPRSSAGRERGPRGPRSRVHPRSRGEFGFRPCTPVTMRSLLSAAATSRTWTYGFPWRSRGRLHGHPTRRRRPQPDHREGNRLVADGRSTGIREAGHVLRAFGARAAGSGGQSEHRRGHPRVHDTDLELHPLPRARSTHQECHRPTTRAALTDHALASGDAPAEQFTAREIFPQPRRSG
jgi:hypothetical protein